ncbi:MAG: restriction endonuclease [Synergistaceae bacterium]|nr:restriction endonuclease [Synergistaceae bacterium]
MPVPITQEIRKPLLEAFRDEMPHSYVIGELFSIITKYIGEDPNEMSSGDKNILREHIKKARSDLKQHGLLSSPSKNTYMITSLGLDVLDEDPVTIDDDYLARLRTRGTSEALAESEFEVSPEPEPDSQGTDSLDMQDSDSESESQSTYDDSQLESDSENESESESDTESDSGTEAEAETESEILDDTVGDLDFTGGEEDNNMNNMVETPEDGNQVIEAEYNNDNNTLEDFGDDDASEFNADPEPEETFTAHTQNMTTEPENLDSDPDPESEPDPEPEPDYESESEQEQESESDSDFVITTSVPSPNENIASSSVKSLESVLEKFNAELADEVLRKTAAIPSDKFEMLVIDLLSKMGYRAFQNARYTTEVSGDDCIHGVILDNEPGLIPIYIQARKLSPSKKVGKGDIQAFVKALADKGGKGLFATTASFSAQAVNYARAEKIMLIDGSRLANLMITNNFCVSVEKVFEIKSIDTESFSEYEKQ